LKAQRPQRWLVQENIDSLAEAVALAADRHPQVLVDSLSQWFGGMIAKGLNRYSLDQLRNILDHEAAELCKVLQGAPKSRIVILSSEVGAGVTPALKVPRLFREALGRANCRVAAASRSVVLMSCGLPYPLKTEGPPLAELAA
jgi:adenosylcobinamide kinase/adenosylcobinamide-phosphate guanylyltransferase